MTIAPKANLQLVYVSDISRSTAFYKSIFKSDPIFISPRYVAFKADANGEALFAIWTGFSDIDKLDSTAARFSEIGIMLSSNAEVDLLFDEWQDNKEITVVREPYDEVFGRTFLVKDPDGHIIRVCPRD